MLRPWINAADVKDPSKKRKFIFRRDSRDISQIWFYDPELGSHFAIPYRDTSHPAISVWELREALARAKEQGKQSINEQAIFDAYERMREIEQEAVKKTKAARRSAQRRKIHSDVNQPKSVKPPSADAVQQSVEPIPDLQPFDEMDDWS